MLTNSLTAEGSVVSSATVDSTIAWCVSTLLAPYPERRRTFAEITTPRQNNRENSTAATTIKKYTQSKISEFNTPTRKWKTGLLGEA
jgi:hypothetical protein